MNTANNKNLSKTTFDFQDIINERLTKTKAILDCLLAAGDSRIILDQETIYNTIWTAHDFLREIINCQAELSKFKRGDLTPTEESL